MGGTNVAMAKGTYGTLGTAAPGNIPGARIGSAVWTDAAQNLWLFGGEVPDFAGGFGEVGDLWKYSLRSGEWTWMGGLNVVNVKGTYGTYGSPDTGNIPGARQNAVSWADSSGNLWLFGGMGYDSTGVEGIMNDLWRYTPSTNEWTWMGGSKSIGVDDKGVYGTQGMAASSNVPGVRSLAVSWTDVRGNFWLFGGYGIDSTGKGGYLNDLWKYSNGEWTWISGSGTVNQIGTYGTQGNADASNVPGARQSAMSWTDAGGNLWLFGGLGFDSTGTFSELNDLWKYSESQWTWMGGAKLINQQGIYGIQGTAASTNAPGARYSAISWRDISGNLWLFSGQGLDSKKTSGELNDLWEYQP
jgi:N-acetylneuraminic acid mutarotase